MKVKTINLSWFRGAGQEIQLDTDGKNVVIYGANGTGKSSFVDALEYIVNEGRVIHLVHRSIGSKQVKGIVNTHRPPGTNSDATFAFDDGTQVYVKINQENQLVFGSDPDDFIQSVQSWQLEKLLLRQDEVANFIVDTPGGKYSVLLPLLGLDEFETIADNLNKLAKNFADVSEYSANKIRLKELKDDVSGFLADTSNEALQKLLITCRPSAIMGHK